MLLIPSWILLQVSLGAQMKKTGPKILNGNCEPCGNTAPAPPAWADGDASCLPEISALAFKTPLRRGTHTTQGETQMNSIRLC
jgi:hypothetical protein